MRRFKRAVGGAVVAAGVMGLAGAADAQPLVCGSCVPASDYLTSDALPAGFKLIEAETKGAVKWKAIAGAQIADCKSTFSAVKDDLMQGGLAIPTCVPNLLPSNAMIPAQSSSATTWSPPPAPAARRCCSTARRAWGSTRSSTPFP